MTCGTLGASADNGKVRIWEETTYAELATGNPKFDELRFLSESLKQDTTTQLSNEITGDRQVNDIVRSSVSGSGDIAFELSYQSLAATDKGMDILWKAAFQATAWTARIALTAATITFQASGVSGSGNPEIDDSGNGLAVFLVHRIIAIQGSSQAANNCFAKVLATAAGTLQVKPLTTTGDFVTDASAGESVTIVAGPQITNAKTCRAYNIEVEFTDLTNVFKRVVGAVPSTFALNIPLDGQVTGSIGFLLSSESRGTATLGDGAPTLPEATDVMSSVDNVLTFTENLAEFDIISFGVNFNNNLRARRVVGNPSARSIGAGRLEGQGTLTAYFADAVFYNKYLNFTQTSFIVAFQDTASNAYVLDLPAVKLTAGKQTIDGTNTDVISDMGFSVKKHATQGFMVRLSRFDAADTPG